MAANASLISHNPMSPKPKSNRPNNFRTADTGPSVNRCGSTAVTADPSTSPSGSTPNARATSAVPTSVASAPSLSGEELPAVTGPVEENAGLRLGQFVRGRVGADGLVAFHR